jgi:hypothetical protein
VAGVTVLATKNGLVPKNGLATEDDSQRLAHLQTAVVCVAECLTKGAVSRANGATG